MKVAEAARLVIDFDSSHLLYEDEGELNWNSLDFTEGDHQSLALAILRAASSVYNLVEVGDDD